MAMNSLESLKLPISADIRLIFWAALFRSGKCQGQLGDRIFGTKNREKSW